MKPLHNGLKGNGSLITICTFLILSSIYLISTAFTTLPGTYAWFTSETSVSGTIQNATTEDLLQIQASEVQYGRNCSIENTLTVKNIADKSTEVTVLFKFDSGEELLISQKLKPGQSLTTAPDAITDMTGGCGATSLTYQIRGFINYVDETYSVEVDSNELKETMIPEEEESKEEQQKDQDEINVDEPNKDEPEEQKTENQEETHVNAEEEVQPPTDEDHKQEEQAADQPQTNEEAESNDQPQENRDAVEEASEENQDMEVEEEAVPDNSLASD